MRISEQVKAQTRESSYPHFEGTWDELAELVEKHVGQGVVHNEHVTVVPVPPERFRASVVEAKEGDKLRAFWENGLLHVVRHGPKPVAKAVDVVVVDDEIVAIEARITNSKEPPHPLLMARLMSLQGPGKHIFSGEEFRDSVLYWSNKVFTHEYRIQLC